MDDQFPDRVAGDSDETVESYPTLESKIQRATEVIHTALEQYQNPALLWTGGKDSTLALSIAVRVADALEVDPPIAVFPDHLQHFTEINAFVDCWAEEWSLDLVVARNDSVRTVVRERALDPGDAVPIDALSDRNRWHVRRILGCTEETFPFLLGTRVGDYLLRQLPLNDALDDREIDALITGTRWPTDEKPIDEGRRICEATEESDGVIKRGETFVSSGRDSDLVPPHDRVNPILPFGEQDVWNAFFTDVFPDVVESYPRGHVPDSPADLPDGVEPASLPIPSLYFDGFRSLGSEAPPERPGDMPAWNQPLCEPSTGPDVAGGDSYVTAEESDAERVREGAEPTTPSDRLGSL